MIIPINNGRTITTIYIPNSVTTTNPSVLEPSNSEVQSNNEPTLATWIVLGVVLIFLITLVTYFIKWLKDIFGGKE